MWQIIKTKKVYFVCFTIFLLSGLFLLALFTKEETFLFVNRNHTKALDFIFRYGTDLGKGTVYAALIIFTLFVKFRYTLTVCLAAVIETILVQGPKKLVFTDALRPIKYFGGIENLHVVEHVKVHSHYSFPSGHTAVAFCVFTLLALFINRKQLELPFLFLALFVGYSRIYLVQHFFIDVYVGALIGTLSALFCFWLVNKKRPPLFTGWGWLDRSFTYNGLRRCVSGNSGTKEMKA